MRISKKYVASAALAMVALSSPASAQVLSDDFTGTGGPDSTKWTVSTQQNGSPFGCQFATSEVWKSNGDLIMNVNPNTKKCSEIKSKKSDFKYGKYLVLMTPSTFAGGNSSFFLYTGASGTSTHYEIDIEIINGGKTIHTNYFIQGGDNLGKYVKQYPIPKSGQIQLGFEWKKDSIRWFWVDGTVEKDLRYDKVSISTPMNLFVNHWYGDNSTASKNFLGTHSGGGGQAKYNKIEVYQ
jgi:endo-1,3-1,4-beta-glycanase ExoK